MEKQYKSKEKDRAYSRKVFLQQRLKKYWEKRRDALLMLPTIHEDIWNMLKKQHITTNVNRWDYPNISGCGMFKNIRSHPHGFDLISFS